MSIGICTEFVAARVRLLQHLLRRAKKNERWYDFESAEYRNHVLSLGLYKRWSKRYFVLKDRFLFYFKRREVFMIIICLFVVEI